MLAASLALVLTAAPAPLKVALMPLGAGEGIPAKTAQSLTDALAAEVRRIAGVQLMTGDQLTAVLSVERQKALVGCHDDSCMSEVAGAMDVDRLILGSLAKLGKSWILHLQLVDARKAATLRNSDRRKKGGSIDDLLDDLPGMARELFAGVEAMPPPDVTGPLVIAKPSAPTAPVSTVEVPYGELDRAKLALVEDGAGHALAFVPFAGLNGPVFYGDGHTFHALRVFGGGSEGVKSFDLVFWEPRARAPTEASFDFRDGEYRVTCGKKRMPYREAANAVAKLRAARFFQPSWGRRAYALARDDEGDYFYVDRAREPEDSRDLRLYVGTQGAMSAVDTRVLASDSSGDVLGTSSGKLKLNLRQHEAEWLPPAGKQKLELLELQDNARLIYGALGVYRGQALGTPCDGTF
jgi:hypothetical protein